MTNKQEKTIPISSPQQAQNQRQFKCKCSKIYKSYPALYTHIKNKHPNQIEEFKSQSKRPKQGQIDKGRPKKHRERPVQADKQGDLLNIIQLGIMEIEKNLRHQVYSNIQQQKFQILEGNAKLKEQDLKNHYNNQKILLNNKILQNIPQKQLISKLNQRNLYHLKKQQSVCIYKEQIKFKNELIQHFNAVTAAKILIELELLEIQQEPFDQETNTKGQINISDLMTIFIQEAEQALWGRNYQIVKIIRNIHSKWHLKIKQFQAQISLSQRQVHQSASQLSFQSQNSSDEPQSGNSDLQEENNKHQSNKIIDSCIN